MAAVMEFIPSLSLDDGELWPTGPFGGIQPHLAVALETEGQADGGDGRGVYGEIPHRQYPSALAHCVEWSIDGAVRLSLRSPRAL